MNWSLSFLYHIQTCFYAPWTTSRTSFNYLLSGWVNSCGNGFHISFYTNWVNFPLLTKSCVVLTPPYSFPFIDLNLNLYNQKQKCKDSGVLYTKELAYRSNSCPIWKEGEQKELCIKPCRYDFLSCYPILKCSCIYSGSIQYSTYTIF